MKKILLLFAVLLILPHQAFAGGIPPHTANFFVNDFAGVLSDGTASHIVERNLRLSQISDAQIVMTTVEFTDGQDANQFAVNMLNQWGIGGSGANNGVLILFITEQEDYQIRVGDGLLTVLPAGDLDRIAVTYIEQPFDEGNFDLAARVAFDQVFDIVYAHYAPMAGTAAAPVVVTQVYAAPNPVSSIISVIMIVLFVIMFISIFGGRRRGIGRRRRGFGGSMFWWLMPSPIRRRRPPGGGGFGGGLGGGTPTTRPPSTRYSGHSTPFGGGGRSSGGGIGRGGGGSRSGGGGRSSGGGIGRRR